MAFAIVLLTGALACQVKAQYLIVVDDSNPHAVVFTGSGASAIASDATHTYAQGITLDGFSPSFLFVSSVMANGPTLVAAADGTPTYTSAQSGTVNGISGIEISGTSLASTNGNMEDFVAGMPAFTGSATFDLAANTTFSFILPANGTVGNIYAGSDTINSKPGVLIGSYIVRNAAAPEPGTVAMMLVGALGLFGFMRAKSRAALRA